MNDDDIPEGLFVLESVLDLFNAWKNFKSTHDYQGFELSCCDNSKKLFAALEEVERRIERFAHEI